MSKVDDWFITPLEAHFEAQPTEGGRHTILADLEDYTPEQLEAAVEWLKRSRQSVKTFPSPKECLRAMAAIASRPQSVVRAMDGRITRENYASCAVAFNAGRKEPPVIEAGTPQWDAWIEYFEWLGVHWMLRIIHGEDRKKWTVPTRWPHEFDGRYATSGHSRAA